MDLYFKERKVITDYTKLIRESQDNDSAMAYAFEEACLHDEINKILSRAVDEMFEEEYEVKYTC